MSPDLAAINHSLGITRELLKTRRLAEYSEAAVLELAETGSDGKDHFLVPEAATAWRKLKAAALTDGVSLLIVSGFRSIDRQAEIIRRKIDAGSTTEEVLTVCAPPGFSEHHTGRAIDVSTAGSPVLEIEFEQTPAFSWLSANAANFGFYMSYPAGNPFGYQYEPWHWCFIKTESCSHMHATQPSGFD
jgi:zinc D-Ala-D-Ala carboxypeptidase